MVKTALYRDRVTANAGYLMVAHANHQAAPCRSSTTAYWPDNNVRCKYFANW